MRDLTARFRPPPALGEGVRGALVFLIAAPFSAAVVAAGAAGAVGMMDKAPGEDGLFLLAPALVFTGALFPAALAGFATGAGAAWTGKGVGLYLLAALAAVLATLAVHGARVGFAPVAAATLAGLAVPPSLAATWFAAQLGLIARREEG